MNINMVKILSEEGHESFEIIVGHRLNQKLLIMRKEEETSTLSHTFTWLLDSLVVLWNVWVHANFQVIILEAVKLSQVSKDIWRELCTNDLLVNHVMGVDLIDGTLVFQEFRVISHIAEEFLHLLFDSFLMYMICKHYFLIFNFIFNICSSINTVLIG